MISQFINESIVIWDKCVDSEFLIQMQKDNLKKEIFLKYLIQDSLYLRDYLKTYSYGFIKCKSWKDMKFFASSMSYVNDTENLTRINYLSDFNLNDNDIDKMKKSKECKEYTEFLLNIGENEDIPSILAAVLPCMLSYNYVFDKISNQTPNILSGYYTPLVNDYVNDKYRQIVKIWTDFTNQILQNVSNEKLLQLKDIFHKASIYELIFWNQL